MTGMTADALATAAGTTRETVETLADRGLLEREVDGYPTTAISRVRLVLAFQEAGVPIDAVTDGVEREVLPLAFVDELMPDPPELLPESCNELHSRLGLPSQLVVEIRSIIGGSMAQGEDRVRDDDAALLALFARARTLDVPDEELLQIMRTTATAVHAIVRAQRDFVDDVLIAPRLAAGESEGEVLGATSPARRAFRVIGAELTTRLLGRFVDDAVFQSVVELAERSLAGAGLVQATEPTLPAIAFADVTGYTDIADTLGDEEAGRTARRFGEIVGRTSIVHGGRLTKLLGDGAMVSFPDAHAAVVWALDLAKDGAELPPVHVGIDAGRFVRRDGDYFGTVINRASRVADRAGPGEVLVTDAVTAGIDDAGVRFDDLGTASLKNLRAPVHLFRAVRTER